MADWSAHTSGTMTLQAFLRELTSADNLPLLLALVALLGFLAGLKVGAKSRWSHRPSKGRWRTGMKLVNPDATTARNDRTDPAAQLTTVMNAEFRPKRLMSRNEARAFLQIERLLRSHRMGWRVMAQVSLGEVLTSTDAKAFAAVNSKRVDMLVIARLKRRKLALKDEIERLKDQQTPDIIA